MPKAAPGSRQDGGGAGGRAQGSVSASLRNDHTHVSERASLPALGSDTGPGQVQWHREAKPTFLLMLVIL